MEQQTDLLQQHNKDEDYCNGPSDCKQANHVHVDCTPQGIYSEQIAENQERLACAAVACHKTIMPGDTYFIGNFTMFRFFFCSKDCFEKGPDW